MNTPLADRMRPQTLEDVVGQRHLLGEGRALRRIIEGGKIPNLIFYGPSGVGKTTVARIIAARSDMRLHKLNGTTASTADIKSVIAEVGTLAGAGGILLYLDEIQYFNKKQQQTLLEHIENGDVTLIASTTENPYFYVYSALLSRSTVFEFKAVEIEDTEQAVKRGFAFLEQEQALTLDIEDGVTLDIARACGGDVRKAINAVELSVLSADLNADGSLAITRETVAQLGARSAMKYDREGDEHYDILSAFQKSMRGSDPNAAIHYLARLLEAGDLLSACRRLMVCAAEDVGLAYPQIIPIVKAAVDMALQVGLPEARIPLADAVVLVCQSPKSNSAYEAYDAAARDIRAGKSGPIPRQLQNKHFDGEDAAVKGQFYRYPHSFEGHWVPQQYLPDVLKDTVYYTPGDNKTEQGFAAYWQTVKAKYKNG
ncbi:MAG: replication-associated recombination protein A [Ruminococcaceae bacterium]|nr:replication-associated recombination protein A [Oscillospiraceae bacterium]